MGPKQRQRWFWFDLVLWNRVLSFPLVNHFPGKGTELPSHKRSWIRILKPTVPTLFIPVKEIVNALNFHIPIVYQTLFHFDLIVPQLRYAVLLWAHRLPFTQKYTDERILGQHSHLRTIWCLDNNAETGWNRAAPVSHLNWQVTLGSVCQNHTPGLCSRIYRNRVLKTVVEFVRCYVGILEVHSNKFRSE